MTTEETPQAASAIERRVRRLEDAHASMDKSIGALGTQLALAEMEQRHTRELMDSRFTGVETAVAAVASKVDTMTVLLQAQSTDPQATVINREVATDIAVLKSKVLDHDNIIQQGIGAEKAFRIVVTGLGVIGTILGSFNFLHNLGVIH